MKNVDTHLVLKTKVQNLTDKGLLSFKNPQLNVQQNPLPGHTGAMNLIIGAKTREVGKIFSWGIEKAYTWLVAMRHCECNEGLTNQIKMDWIRHEMEKTGYLAGKRR